MPTLGIKSRGSVSGFTTNFNVLFSLQLKENVRVLGDGNCMADAFLKTAHVGQAVMCVMPSIDCWKHMWNHEESFLNTFDVFCMIKILAIHTIWQYI